MTGAYPTAVAYPTTYQSKFAPGHLATVCLLQGRPAPPIDQPYAFCELGSGIGFTTNLLAAANPFATFHAIDFNPEHVAQAQALATAGALANVRHHALDFAAAGDARLPDFDVIALHGVWTWVGADVQGDVLRFIDRRLKPGGLLFVSYTARPGMNSVAALRQVIGDLGLLAGDDLAQRVEKVRGFLRALRDSNPGLAGRFPGLMSYVDAVGQMADASAIHDLLAPGWSAADHRSVRAAMETLGCAFVGDCDLAFNRPSFAFVGPAAAQIAGTAGLGAESLKDFISQRTFRRDLYRRAQQGDGARRPPVLRFVLREAIDPKQPLRLPGGTFPADPALLEWLLAALHAPVEPAALASHPALQRFDRLTVEQHFLALVVAGVAAAAIDGAARPMPRLPRLSAFNAAAIDQPIVPDDARILAAPAIGTGAVLDRATAYLLWAVAGEGDAADRLAGRLLGEGRTLTVGGQATSGREATVAAARPMIERFRARDLPRLARLGVIA